MFARVPIERITDNPFQTRIQYGAIEELAASVLKMKPARPDTSGLLQVPPARIVTDGRVLDPAEYGGVLSCLDREPRAVVELAAGHRRLRAFHYLQNGGGQGAEYATFPVIVQVLDDAAMADIAWQENAERQDLNPIEEALAIKRAMERFGWTQAQVAKRWGLSRSAVANKLRLLQLPEDAQAAIRSGAITERHGRTLLTAMKRSPRIYEDLAREVLPVAVAPEAAAQARDLINESPGSFYRVTDGQPQTCAACGVEGGNGYRRSVDASWLCLACYRAATDWTPPSTADTKGILDRITQIRSRSLKRAIFPQEEPFTPDPSGGIYRSRCVGCDRRRDDVCLDKACFEAKEEAWYAVLVNKLNEELLRRFGATAPTTREFNTSDLDAINPVDAALAADVCVPGQCNRLRFRFVTYEARSHICPVPDLPFIYSCAHHASHAACRRRYLQRQEVTPDVERKRQHQQAVDDREAQARNLMRQTAAIMALALLDGQHPALWRALAERVGQSPRPDQSIEDSARQIMASILDGTGLMYLVNWHQDDALETFASLLQEHVAELGVPMPRRTSDMVRKLDRIERFILDDEGRVRRDLTPEQVRGNLTNLTKIQAWLQSNASEEEWAQLDERIIRLQAALLVSRETS